MFKDFLCKYNERSRILATPFFSSEYRVVLFDEGSFEGLGDVNHEITHFLKFAYYIQIIYTGLIVGLILLDVFYLRFS